MFDATAGTNFVKKKYTKDYIQNSLTERMDPILAAAKKLTDASGSNTIWVADVSDYFNVSVDFGTAQTAASSSTATIGSQFTTPIIELHGVAQISSALISQTRNNDGAWTKALSLVMDKTLAAMNHFLTLEVISQGWGEVATINNVSGSTASCKEPTYINRVVVGMPVVFSSSINAATLRSATVVYVTAVDYSANVITFSAALSTVSAANNDTMFIAGCRQNSATPTRLCCAGLDAYIPYIPSGGVTDTTISTLYGVTRSTNTRLYGQFTDATSGGSLLNSLIANTQACTTIGNAKRLDYFVSQANFTDVAKDLHASVRYSENGADGAKSVGTKGGLRIYADGNVAAYVHVSRTMDDTKIFGFESNAGVVLRSQGELVYIESEDGLTMGRISTSSGYEVRYMSMRDIEVPNPAACGRIQVKAPV